MIESKLRRREWTEGYWLELGDGQRWCLPKLTFKPSLSIRETGAALPAECTTIPELSGMILVFTKAKTSGLEAFVIRAIVVRLLQENYLLDEEGAKGLLPFGIDGIDPGHESGILGDVLKAIDELILTPAKSAAILGITPPGVN